MSGVIIDETQLKRIAREIRQLKDFPVYSFDIKPGTLFPDVGAPGVVDYFFASVLHQFGFWYNDEFGYVEPFYDYIDGVRYKGSDYVWRIFTKRVTEKPDFLSLEYRAEYSVKLFEEDMSGDSDECKIPMKDEHYKLAVGYAKDMLSMKETPETVVEKANKTRFPELYILDFLKEITGYKEDPLQKKAMLLVLSLANRPEHFINISDEKNIKPIVDYHIQRSALRTGIVKVIDSELYKRLKERLFVSEKVEQDIRKAIYKAIMLLSEHSGKSIAAIDYFFYNARVRCPEMTEPECEMCLINDICAKNKELFQPVVRTTYY